MGVIRSAATWRTVVANSSCSGVRVGIAASARDRKSTRLNSSHLVISYAVFCLKKKPEELHHLDFRQSHRERQWFGINLALLQDFWLARAARSLRPNYVVEGITFYVRLVHLTL